MSVTAFPQHSPQYSPTIWIAPWRDRELLQRVFRVDRRGCNRWNVEGCATLLGLGAHLGCLIELDQLEAAPWWISGHARIPIALGARVSLGFSDRAGRAAAGTVQRCEAQLVCGFRVAVQFDPESFL